MTKPKAHEQYEKHVAANERDPETKPPPDAGADEPKGTPTSDRHQSETVKQE